MTVPARVRDGSASPELVVHLESPLPPPLWAGRAGAVFLVGVCHHPEQPIVDLWVDVDGRRHRVSALRIPRGDIGLGRSGFWATVPIPARPAPGVIQLRMVARVADGSESSAPLAQLEVVAPAPAPSEELRVSASPDTIAVCMATYEPDRALLRTQVESLRAQTDTRWVCLVSDDCSSPERFAGIREVIGDDPRFVLSRSETWLGFYRNFERALRMVPAGIELVALCDQDDRWHPDKLAALRGAIGGAQLAYSDQRLVDERGRVLRETMWHGRRNNASNLTSMLVANTVTGAAGLFRRAVIDIALPFPETPGLDFHDQWLALVALATGDLAYVSRPLYDYVQHAGAVFGDVTHGSERRGSRRLMDRWRAAYFCGYVPRELLVQTLLGRAESRIAARKRTALRRYLAAERSPVACARLAARPLRLLAGKNETLGTETDLVGGLVWRFVAARAPARLAPGAQVPPPDSFDQLRLRRWRSALL